MREFFGLDSGYVRPVPPRWWRADILVAAVLTALGSLGVWAMQQIPNLPPFSLPWAMVSVAIAGVLICFRRRLPTVTMLLTTGVHFVVVGNLLPLVAQYLSMQIVYFLALYSAMAWARDRTWLMVSVVLVMVVMVVWVTMDVAANVGPSASEHGPWYAVAMLALTTSLNVAFFGAAIWLGRNAWEQARDLAELEASRALVDEQNRQLAEQSVAQERLRIARDLHDSVAHHVALIGVQAAAARRAMGRKPEQAAEALQGIEASSRATVQELRSMLGSLRSDGESPAERHSLDALPQLLAENEALGLTVDYCLVGDQERLDTLGITPARTLYRVVQEALTNVRKHSTARNARLVLRVDHSSAEAEVTDDGMPVSGSEGAGLGQLGIRERVALLGGTTEIGRRPGRGYRVLARIPLKPGPV